MEGSGTMAGTTQNAPQLLTLLQVLSNPLILHHTVQYLPISSLLALGASSKPLRGIVHQTPNVFRYLELSRVKSVQFELSRIDSGGEVWRNELDENVTEDDFYAGPLRGLFGILRRRRILQNVQTLVLDGLSVTSELIAEIILDDSFNVRLLSVREVQNLNEGKLMRALEYSVRPTRPVAAPRLQGLYIFGKRDTPDPSASECSKPTAALSPGGAISAQTPQIGAEFNQRSRDALSNSLGGDGDGQFVRLGATLPKQPMRGWEQTMMACRGLISFDGILCKGPRHEHIEDPDPAYIDQRPWYLKPAAHLPATVATVAIKGCSFCHSAPEGILTYGTTPVKDLPLLAPPPFHSSTVKAATRSGLTIGGKKARLLCRCRDCLKGRYCESCYKWWCEDCYEIPTGSEHLKLTQVTLSGLLGASHSSSTLSNNFKVGARRDCYECGFNCAECTTRTEHRCKLCGGGYCMIHNEGSTITTAGRHAINGCRC